jgi:RNA polymerase sigma-70 factor (ECF subfamily)
LNLIQTYQEPELVLLLQQRSQSAFGYLYDHYAGALHTVVVSIVGEDELANDVLQEVFVKIWRQIGSYDSTKGRLYTWMLNIARNAAIDMVRSRQFQNGKQNRELNEDVYGAAGSTEKKVEHIGLRKLVQGLKPEWRNLVELSYFEGYTQDEISKMMDIPLGTVKTRIRSGLQALRQLLQYD